MSLVQGKSPIVQVKEPYGKLDMYTCTTGLSSCNPRVHGTPADNVQLRIKRFNCSCLVVSFGNTLLNILTNPFYHMGALKNEDGSFGYPQHKYDWEIRFFFGYTLLTKDL